MLKHRDLSRTQTRRSLCIWIGERPNPVELSMKWLANVPVQSMYYSGWSLCTYVNAYTRQMRLHFLEHAAVCVFQVLVAILQL